MAVRADGPLVRGLVAALSLLAASEIAGAQQDLGHKLLGAVGIDAGVQAPAGFYVATRGAHYTSSSLRDRNGGAVPLDGFDLSAWGATLGVSYTVKPAKLPYLSFAAGAPAASASINVDDPRVSVDRSGFGDMFFQPLQVGWRGDRFDGLTSFALYIPTGHFEPRSGSGVGRGFWTQQLSIGGAAFFSQDRQRRISALLSFDRNSRKRGIDITRGNTLQIQGGGGLGVAKVATVGVAGYALWQVSRDRGADIPPALHGLSERVFALGPEIQFTLPKAGLRAEFRIEFEFGARARPQGDMMAGGLAYRAWAPRPAP